MGIIKEDGKNTGYSYKIVSTKDKKSVIISSTSSKCKLEYDLADGKLISGEDTAVGDDVYRAESCVGDNLKEWQEELGMRYQVKFLDNSDCYYDFGGRKLHNASGKKNHKDIQKLPVDFTPTERMILEYVVRRWNFVCTYDDIGDAVDKAADKERALARGTQHQHLSHIRAYDQAINDTITYASGGYRYIGNRARWVTGESEKKEEPGRQEFSLKEFGIGLLTSGGFNQIAWTSQDKGFMIRNVSEASFGEICKFFFPDTCAWVDENAGGLQSLDRRSVKAYIDSINRDIDTVWERSKQWLQKQFEWAMRLALYPTYRPKDPVPNSEDDLRKWVPVCCPDGRLELMPDFISPIINSDLYVNVGYFQEKSIKVEMGNLLDAIVALLWIGFYRECKKTFSELDALSDYRYVLVAKIEMIFFPGSPDYPGSASEEYEEMEIRRMIKLFTKEYNMSAEVLKNNFKKYLLEQRNINAIYDNSEIDLSGPPSLSENDTPGKTR